MMLKLVLNEQEQASLERVASRLELRPETIVRIAIQTMGTVAMFMDEDDRRKRLRVIPGGKRPKIAKGKKR